MVDADMEEEAARPCRPIRFKQQLAYASPWSIAQPSPSEYLSCSVNSASAFYEIPLSAFGGEGP